MKKIWSLVGKRKLFINTDKEKVYDDFLLKEYKKAQLTLKWYETKLGLKNCFSFVKIRNKDNLDSFW